MITIIVVTIIAFAYFLVEFEFVYVEREGKINKMQKRTSTWRGQIDSERLNVEKKGCKK